jgi:aminomethyltransferase
MPTARLSLAPIPTAEIIARRREITSLVKRHLIDVLQLDLTEHQIGLDSPLFGAGLGLDSVDAVGLAAAIEEHFGVQVLDSDIQVFRSINTIVDFILLRQDQIEKGEPIESAEALVVDEGLAARELPAFGQKREFEQYLTLRTQVGLVDRSDNTKIRVSGDGAQALLDFVVAGNVAEIAVGGMLHSLVLREDGTILAIVWLAREENGYLLLAGADQREEILDCLDRHRGDFAVEISDITAEHRILSLTGPKAQELILDLFDEDLLRVSYAEFVLRPWGEARLFVGRFGETGEFDYRLIAPAEVAEAVLAAVCDTGSLYGLQSCEPSILKILMMEMKSIHQGSMVLPDSRPAELDLQWMVQFSKESFRGRDAALADLTSFARRAVILVLADGQRSAQGAEVWFEGCRAGFVQTDGYSFTLDRRIALALVERDCGWSNLPFEVVDGQEVRAAVSRSAPLFLTRTVVESLNL